MSTPQDIIKTALDILAGPEREVELVISDGIEVKTRYGTLTGLSGQGDDAYVTVDDYRFWADEDGGIITARTLVDISEIISISPVS